MKRIHITGLLLFVVLLLYSSGLAHAQFGGGGGMGMGGGGRGGGGMGMGGRGGGGMGGMQPSPQMIRMGLNMIRSMDKNGDGILDPDEIPENRRPMLNMVLSRFNIEPGQSINLASLEKFAESGVNLSTLTADRINSAGIFTRRGAAAGAAGAAVPGVPVATGISPTRVAMPENPLVPYFGKPQKPLAPIAGFGVPSPAQPRSQNYVLAASSAQGGTRSGRAARPGQAAESAERNAQIETAARELMQKKDKNRNGTLDLLNGEWVGLSFNASAADKNRDGRLSLSEVIEAMGGQPSIELIRTEGRVATVQDRMPTGVPTWFLERDKNKDGQLTLLEWANGQPLTDAIVSEFESFDVNNDGYVTIMECYNFLKKFDEEKKKREDTERLAAIKEGGVPATRDTRRGGGGGGNTGERRRRDAATSDAQPPSAAPAAGQAPVRAQTVSATSGQAGEGDQAQGNRRNRRNRSN